MIHRSAGRLLLPLLIAFATSLSYPPRVEEAAESREASGETASYALPYVRSGLDLQRLADVPPASDETIVLPRHDAPLPASARAVRLTVRIAGEVAGPVPGYFPASTAARLPYDANAPPLSI
jgi:hypothetical protein